MSGEVTIHESSTPTLGQQLQAATALMETSGIPEARAAVNNREMKRHVVRGTSGFDVKCVEKPNDDFSCPLCLSLVRDACAHTCGQLFCASCWDACSKDNGCPCCRQMGEVHPAHRDQRAIANIMISCNACEEVFRLGDLEKHLDQACKHRPAYCTLCNAFSTPALESYHATRACKHRLVQCTDCSETVQANLLTRHSAECKGRLVECGECKAKVKLVLLPSHQTNQCPHRSVVCEMCKKPVKKSQMSLHLTQAADVHFEYLLRQRERDQKTIQEMQGLLELLSVAIVDLQGKLRQQDSKTVKA